MAINNKLEEIFWKEGKFVKTNGEEINPKPIGKPKLVQWGPYSSLETKKVMEMMPNGILIQLPYHLKILQEENSEYSKVNSFSRVISDKSEGISPHKNFYLGYLFNFYKI